jgi:outer membrane immunogenic protein
MYNVQRFGLFAGLLALIAGPVHADDYTAPTNWTGLYGGVNAGYGWNGNSVAFAGDNPNGSGAGNFLLNVAFASFFSFDSNQYSQSPDAKGFVGGGQLGYNWRLAKDWVAGLETDIQYSGMDGDATTTGTVLTTVVSTASAEQDLKWFGTVRGRLGFLATEQLLLFGTAGFAYGRTEASASITAPGTNVGSVTTSLQCPLNQVCIAGSDQKTSTGWTAGGGFEWALWSNITLKGEYLHVDLGDQTITLVAQPPATGTGFATANFDNSFDVVRGGLNYRF